MPQPQSSILLHIIFSTSNQELWINKVFRPRLHAYLMGLCRENNSEAHAVNGTANHVHVVCSLPRTLPISKLVEALKESSEAWLKEEAPALADFAWQAGYGAFSFSHGELPAVIDFVAKQGDYHRKVRFKQEFVAFLKNYGIEFDAKDLWY